MPRYRLFLRGNELNKTPITDRERQLEKRVEVLETAHRQYLLAMELAASMAAIHNLPQAARKNGEILEETAEFIQRLLIDFSALGLYRVQEECADFELCVCHPQNAASPLQDHMERLIASGEFAWALNRNHAVVVPPEREGGPSVLLHVIATPSRIRGMVVGVLKRPEDAISSFLLNLLTMICNHAAHALENQAYRNLLEEDLKTQKGIELALREAREKAEAANRSKSLFLADMSHEIRTPLNGILGLAELLSTTDGVPSQAQAWAGTIHQAGQSLEKLLNDLLDFSRMEAGRLELEAIPFNPRRLVEETGELFRETARKKGARLEIAVDPALPEQFLGDANRLRQVLLNLVSNALKFTPQGSVTVTAWGASDDLNLEVRDTGLGIPKDRLDSLFESYTQADVSTSRTHGGSGLGLSICCRLVKLMGGRITVESDLGHGSLFRVTVPLQAVQGEAPPADFNTNFDPETRLLLVEDDPVNIAVAVGLLKRLGVTPAVAEDGQQALERLDAERFDLVLLDCMLPEKSGFQVCRSLRTREETEGMARTPVLALTALSQPGDREKCLQAGMDGYLKKPLKRSDLEQALGQWLPPAKADHGERSLDLKQFSRLAESLGPETPAVVDKYLLLLPRSMADIKKALGREDADALRESATQLLAPSRRLGAVKISELARRLGDLSRAQRLKEAKPLADALEAETAKTAHALASAPH